MIRHLRWKVVATNMLLISLVLLAVFAAGVLHLPGQLSQECAAAAVPRRWSRATMAAASPAWTASPALWPRCYGSGTVRVAGNSYYDLSDETVWRRSSLPAWRPDEDAGTLDEFHLRYLRQRGYTTTAIAFTDTYLEYTSLHTLLKACSLVGCGALVVLFLCSYLLSGVVTKPVGAAWAQQEQFLSDASHELKTPLTVILSSAELLEQSASPEQAVYVDNIRAEGRRMKALVEDMLTLFRAQKNAGQPAGHRHRPVGGGGDRRPAV